DRLQRFGLRGKLALARRILVELQQERDDVSVLLTAEGAWIIRRHRYTNPLEEIADGHVVPVGDEFRARQGRGHLAAGQFGSVAGRALRLIQRLATPGLVVRVHRVLGRSPRRSRSRRLCLRSLRWRRLARGLRT